MLDFLDTDESETLSLDRDFAQFESLTNHLGTLTSLHEAVQTHGADLATIAVLRSSHLLQGASLSALAVESVRYISKEDALKELATESLSGQIKETATKWAAKILHVANNISTTIMSVVKPIFEGVISLTKAAAAKTWDGVTATGRAIKAHPYKTTLAVVGSIAAVAGILAYCGSNLPGGQVTKEMLTPFFNKVNDMMDQVPWPFGKVKYQVTEFQTYTKNIFNSPQGMVIDQGIKKVTTGVELGYTQSAMHVLGGKLDQAWAATKIGVGAVGARSKSALYSFSTVGNRVFDAVPNAVYRKTGSRVAACLANEVSMYAYGLAIMGLLIALQKLIVHVVVAGLKYIGRTLKEVF